ncbi:hypothetical protein Ancab_033514 [Ancistrocladus abbreviatus]
MHVTTSICQSMSLTFVGLLLHNTFVHNTVFLKKRFSAHSGVYIKKGMRNSLQKCEILPLLHSKAQHIQYLAAEGKVRFETLRWTIAICSGLDLTWVMGDLLEHSSQIILVGSFQGTQSMYFMGFVFLFGPKNWPMKSFCQQNAPRNENKA